MVVAGVERADVHGRRDERPGTGTDGDGSTAPANTRVSLAARDSRWWSLRPGVGQGDRGSRRYRVRLGFANVRIWPKADVLVACWLCSSRLPRLRSDVRRLNPKFADGCSSN